MFKASFFALLVGSAMTASSVTPAQAKTMTYCISVKTWTESGAGTDNFVYLKLIGDKGTSNEFELIGSKENNGLDEFTEDIEDVGMVRTISINVHGDLADHWSPNYIKIYRNTDCAKKDQSGGWSEVALRKSLPYGENHYGATDGANPVMTVSPSGKLVINKKKITVVSYTNNTGPEQDVNLFSESWSDVDSVQISNSTTDTVGAGATVTYESPETVVGTFGGEVSASWSRAIEDIKTTSHEHTVASAFDWHFKAPAKSFIMRRVVFSVPYAEQVYEDSNGGKYAIRKVGAQIVPTGGSGDFLVIPDKNDDGSIDPVSLQDLDDDWFAYLEPAEVAEIKKKYLPKWLSKGYVVDGAVAAQPVAKSAEPEVATQAAPVVTKPVKPAKKQAAASGQVNGGNLTVASYDGGRFEKTGSGEWTEFNSNGEAGATFQETGRDEWSVYLNDASRNVQIQLDVFRKMVGYGEDGGQKRDLYQITSAQ